VREKIQKHNTSTSVFSEDRPKEIIRPIGVTKIIDTFLMDQLRKKEQRQEYGVRKKKS
jgi:hypothetical protein